MTDTTECVEFSYWLKELFVGLVLQSSNYEKNMPISISRMKMEKILYSDVIGTCVACLRILCLYSSSVSTVERERTSRLHRKNINHFQIDLNSKGLLQPMDYKYIYFMFSPPPAPRAYPRIVLIHSIMRWKSVYIPFV